MDANGELHLADLPDSLWQDGHVIMPAALAEQLREELTARGTFAETCGPNRLDKEMVGGAGDDEAIEHFTHRFTTSAARVQFVTIYPDGTFEPTSTDLRSFFHDGRVGVLELACGSGGGLLGMLCTIAELRTKEVQARLPVELYLMAADISRAARGIHECMVERIRGNLSDVDIRLTY